MTDLRDNTWLRERLLESLEAYRAGLSDAPVLHKWSDAQGKGGDGGPDMTFVVSTDEVDRHGDVIVPEGWRLEAYQRNPVFLWAHDYTRPVIGRSVAVWKEPHRLLSRMEFAPTDFAQEVALLYRNRYQRGVSVGFKPLSYEERRQEKTGAFLGIRFLEQELLEISAVPVPANRQALRRAADQAPKAGTYLRDLSIHRGFPPDVSTLGIREEAWPELLARLDDLGKLVEELREMVESSPSSGQQAGQGQGVAEMLAILREARW